MGQGIGLEFANIHMNVCGPGGTFLWQKGLFVVPLPRDGTPSQAVPFGSHKALLRR